MSELSELTLQVSPREKTGRNACNSIRNAGKIPVILYGKDLNKSYSVDDKEKITRLDNEERISLFNGTSVFKVGTDDTLRNMRWRIDKAAKINIAGEILLEIFLRLQEYDNIFKRLKVRHKRDKTGWW